MFNFKKIGKKVLSSALGATLAMGSFLNTQIVKAGELNKEKYWGQYSVLSNAEFILGENYKGNIENLKKELETIGEFKGNLEEELDKLLNKNEKNIYDAVKKCITDKDADFEKLSNISENITGFTLNNGLSYKIATFGECKNKKAIVFIMVSNGGTLEEKHMEVIKKRLKNSNLITEKSTYYDCKNVNFIIRPQDRNAEFLK